MAAINKKQKFKVGTTLEVMLQVKAFNDLITDGDIFTVKGAAKKLGYTPQHIRRLCRQNRLPHIRRGVTENEFHFYFLPEHLTGLFSHVQVSARSKRA